MKRRVITVALAEAEIGVDSSAVRTYLENDHELGMRVCDARGRVRGEDGGQWGAKDGRVWMCFGMRR